MRNLKLADRYKKTQVHALDPSDTAGRTTGGKLNIHHNQKNHRINSAQLKPKKSSVSSTEPLIPSLLPKTDNIEPPIDPNLKPTRFVEALADLYRRLDSSPVSEKLPICIEQYFLLRSIGNSKLLRRCLCSARQYAVDVYSKVVLSAWLRFERREHEFEGIFSMDCSGHVLECPKAALVSGFDINLTYNKCPCNNFLIRHDGCSNLEEEGNYVYFCIDDEEISCVRNKIACLSTPLMSMLYGSFLESKSNKVKFSHNDISVKGMRAVEMYSRSKRLDSFSPQIVLELLCFANRFCCEEMKSACDAHLASLVFSIEEALTLIEYGIEETASLLLASCLQVLLRALPNCLYNPKVMDFFFGIKAGERLAMIGHASFCLYLFLSQVSMEENMVWNTTLILLEKLKECAVERWQKALALHQLGCVRLERKEYKDAQYCFEAAVEVGHVYSMAGVARTKYKQGDEYSAYNHMNSLISKCSKPTGWMYQERSLYNAGRKKIEDLNTATELDPTLSFPYYYRAVAMVEENQTRAAISEISKFIRFKLSPDCLELRAGFFIALKDYANALRDIRALLTLEPNYMILNGKVSGDHLVEILSNCVDQHWNLADCWMQLYDCWSSVDDIGSLAVIHQMLANNPGRSLLRFRQSLLLLRLNCQKAALHSLRLARNHSSSEHEKLVYEGWMLYDIGHREEALSKAEESISIQRSFEAFFLKSYALADTGMNLESSSNVIQLLEEALRCPSDGHRKGQALNNLGSIYVDCGNVDLAANCYRNAIEINHTRAHQGLARVYSLQNKREAAYDEMTKLIEKLENKASAYEKRSEFSDHDMAKNDLNMATQLDPLRTYPYRYRAAVLMDDQKEIEAVEELTKAIAFKPDMQMLHLRAAFHESMGDFTSALQDCEAALCLDSTYKDTLNLYNRLQYQSNQSTR